MAPTASQSLLLIATGAKEEQSNTGWSELPLKGRYMFGWRSELAKELRNDARWGNMIHWLLAMGRTFAYNIPTIHFLNSWTLYILESPFGDTLKKCVIVWPIHFGGEATYYIRKAN